MTSMAWTPPGGTTTLKLVDHKVLPKSGIAILAYSVPGGAGAPVIGFIKAPKARMKKGASKTVAKKRAVKKKTVKAKTFAKKRVGRGTK